MAKSLRSKRKKRLRTIKREISTPHYDKKYEAKMAIMDAVLAGPVAPAHQPSSKAMDVDVPEQPRGRTGPETMSLDDDKKGEEGLYYGVSLKPKNGGIRKRGKSKGVKNRRRFKMKF